MRHERKLGYGCALAAAIVFFQVQAFAQQTLTPVEIPDSPAQAETPAAPDVPATPVAPVQAATANQVPLYSGGVGDDEMDHIRSIENQYNLKILFTEESGTYLADLPVSIKDKAGRILVHTVTNGPVLLVTLPEGSYTVTAADGNAIKDTKVSVSAKERRKLQIRFPTHPGEITQGKD